MSVFKKRCIACVTFVAFGLCLSNGLCLDINSQKTDSDNQLHFFKTGISAYKKGHKDQALKALRYAAEMGHTGANWKLARMYADGDGVTENDYAAFKFFVKIVQDGAEPGSEDESYLSDALVEIGGYLYTGIPDSPVKKDIAHARSVYMQAATNFGNPEAQYRLGRMLLAGEGGDVNSVQAARWFQLSAKKGNAAAQAMLGNMLFQAGKTVRGLAMMTAAYEKASHNDQNWIREMQERAFALSEEADRRTAISLANDMSGNQSSY
ncbi:tetratricopeptide repeat protein [Bartonella tamiae]|uniref:Exopolysaccharide production negative regulator n=1 Tax=Bartonella tamiae Th239 TaxID=1094558 RepID=J1JVL6_9HYPH|nr:tetratricopeptide repeat protein [Bartonella tamiae]EJF88997.1 hypothetical protein ME5_01548 [Bartonella tamiae Th239]EJF94753.1 hypothetical protein MEG_00334 [Bartonella tamiae Th307]